MSRASRRPSGEKRRSRKPDKAPYSTQGRAYFYLGRAIVTLLDHTTGFHWSAGGYSLRIGRFVGTLYSETEFVRGAIYTKAGLETPQRVERIDGSLWTGLDPLSASSDLDMLAVRRACRDLDKRLAWTNQHEAQWVRATILHKLGVPHGQP